MCCLLSLMIPLQNDTRVKNYWLLNVLTTTAMSGLVYTYFILFLAYALCMEEEYSNSAKIQYQENIYGITNSWLHSSTSIAVDIAITFWPGILLGREHYSKSLAARSKQHPEPCYSTTEASIAKETFDEYESNSSDDQNILPSLQWRGLKNKTKFKLNIFDFGTMGVIPDINEMQYLVWLQNKKMMKKPVSTTGESD
ncbi:hypothetical protein Ciccas_004573 [Cichlidogyrus casuarinus]|uniref:Uncharacterized protein n=1 Tax=Cichlidogyrus casuarinus TaxID=1844966 RepID=A0ABD2QB48_9PLAT